MKKLNKYGWKRPVKHHPATLLKLAKKARGQWVLDISDVSDAPPYVNTFIPIVYSQDGSWTPDYPNCKLNHKCPGELVGVVCPGEGGEEKCKIWLRTNNIRSFV